jgi:hypothetical protein
MTHLLACNFCALHVQAKTRKIKQKRKKEKTCKTRMEATITDAREEKHLTPWAFPDQSGLLMVVFTGEYLAIHVPIDLRLTNELELSRVINSLPLSKHNCHAATKQNNNNNIPDFNLWRPKAHKSTMITTRLSRNQ